MSHTNFCRGLPELNINISIIVHFDYFIFQVPVAAGEVLQLAVQLVQLAVQLVLFRQLAIALQLFIHFMWLSHHFGII